MDPLVILVAVPLALIGVTAALLITGTRQSAPVLPGVILLAGIVVNNAILLVERHRGAWQSLRPAARGRCHRRTTFLTEHYWAYTRQRDRMPSPGRSRS